MLDGASERERSRQPCCYLEWASQKAGTTHRGLGICPPRVGGVSEIRAEQEGTGWGADDAWLLEEVGRSLEHATPSRVDDSDNGCRARFPEFVADPGTLKRRL